MRGVTEAMQTDPKLQFGDRGLPMEDVQRSYIMRMPGQKPPKKEVVDPLRSLMKQMRLKMGPDIIEATGTTEDSGAPKVEKLPPHDDRGATPLKNPMKKTVCKPLPGDHGLCITTGFCAAWIGGVSSGKSTCLISCLGRNHARYRYDKIYLMHPRARGCCLIISKKPPARLSRERCVAGNRMRQSN